MASISPTDLMDRAEGQAPGKAALTGAVAVILGISSLLLQGMETIVSFLLVPFEVFYDVVVASVNAVFIRPWDILTGGGSGVEVGAIEATAQALASQFGILTLPMANAIVLLSILVVIAFLALGITSNFAPGVGIDNPLWDRFFTTAEEESDDGE